MVRYYFNIRRENRLIADEEGMELENPDDAMEEALASAHELVIYALKERRPVSGNQIEVTDEQGRIVFAVPVKTLAH